MRRRDQWIRWMKAVEREAAGVVEARGLVLGVADDDPVGSNRVFEGVRVAFGVAATGQQGEEAEAGEDNARPGEAAARSHSRVSRAGGGGASVPRVPTDYHS